MKRVLVAGSTGYIGRYLASELRQRGYWVRALSRSANKLHSLIASIDEPFIGQVTDANSLRGVANGIDVVISAIGITRQKDGLTYDEVDYQGNVNLLRAALAAGVKKFIYISVLHADRMPDLAIVRAKEKFVGELRSSGIPYTVIRPNGYYSDMCAFLDMARKGRVFLFGEGGYRINPIHGRDVAIQCVEAITSAKSEVSFGGPVTYSHRDLARLAFQALHKSVVVSCIPVSLAKFGIQMLKRLTPIRIFGPIEFTVTVLTRDLVGEARGTELLSDFFNEKVRKRKASE